MGSQVDGGWGVGRPQAPGPVQLVPHQPLRSRPQPAFPREGSATKNQEMAGHRAQAAGKGPAWRKRAQEKRLAAAGWAVHFFALPPPPPPHFHFLPGLLCCERAGAAYLQIPCFIQSLLPKHARAVVESKQLLHFLKAKQKWTWCCLNPPRCGRPCGGAGAGSKLPRSCSGQDSRLPAPEVSRKVRKKCPTPPARNTVCPIAPDL